MPLAPSSWRLSYPGTDLTFGGLNDVATFGEAPELGQLDITDQDNDRPNADGRTFGRDTFSGRTITFPSLMFGADTEAEVRRRASSFEAAWRADAIRSSPNAVAQLMASTPRGERVFFGRPRRFARGDEFLPHGLATATADFACATPDAYAARLETVTLTFTPTLGGGLTAPLRAPLSTTPSSNRAVELRVDTELPAHPIVTFEGPITNPELVVVGGLRFRLLTTIRSGESITIDTSPWARTILRSSGVSAAGLFDRTSTRVSRATLPAGSYSVALRGIDATGTARASLSWRSRYSTL